MYKKNAHTKNRCSNKFVTPCCVVVDALWAIGYIAEKEDEGQQEVVAAGIIPDLVTHLEAKERQKIIPALRATANLVMGSDEQVSQPASNFYVVRFYNLIFRVVTSVYMTCIVRLPPCCPVMICCPESPSYSLLTLSLTFFPT